MLEFSKVEIKLKQRMLIEINQLNLTIGLVALVGRNGAGKSTLLRTIIGLNQNYNGKIKVEGVDLKELNRTALAKQIAIVYTKPQIFGNHTTAEVLALGRLPHQNSFAKLTANDNEIIQEIADLLDLTAYLNRPFMELSDGEKQLIMIGRALVQESQILLLDEPSAFLDLVNRHKMMEVLQKIAKKTQKLILFSTHQVAQLENKCDQVLLIDNKRLVQLEKPSEFTEKIYKSFGLK